MSSLEENPASNKGDGGGKSAFGNVPVPRKF
jgi:hypothetical protein